MNIKSICYIFSVLLLSPVSCKNQSKQNSTNENGKTLYEDQLLIEINLTVLEDDVFELYFRDKGEVFDVSKSRKQFVSGKKELQKIVFGLNQHEYPYNLRLDFGNNPKQRELRIKSIVLLYNDGRHEFSKEELIKHFTPNKFLDVDYESMLFNTKVVDNKYDPYFQSNNISAFVNKLILY